MSHIKKWRPLNGKQVYFILKSLVLWARIVTVSDGLNALEPKEIKSGNQLDREIQNGTALIDFSAPWYAPCRLQEPIIRRLVTKFEGKALIATMNIDENSDVALRLGIQSVPTLIIFKNGKEIQRFIGLQSEDALSEALIKLLE